MDIEEYEEAGRGNGRLWVRDEPSEGGTTAARKRLQPPGNEQDESGRRPSRPEWAVRVHQRTGRCLALAGRTGDLGRHEEEGTRRRFQERRPRVAAPGRTDPGSRPPR